MNEQAVSETQEAMQTDLPHCRRRLGRFVLSRILIEDYPETLRTIMGRCIILRCEMLYHMDTFEYVALSPDFDEVEQGVFPPDYEVYISEDGMCIEFKRASTVSASAPSPKPTPTTYTLDAIENAWYESGAGTKPLDFPEFVTYLGLSKTEKEERK